jgi:hypothetical protein
VNVIIEKERTLAIFYYYEHGIDLSIVLEFLNRVVIRARQATQHGIDSWVPGLRLAESIPWNQFLGSLKV